MRSRPVHHIPVRLSKTLERSIYVLASALLASGLGWLLLEHFVRVEGDFGPTHHWAQPWLLKLHGVLAMLSVWGFGMLWPFHIRRAWHLERHRRSGGTMFAVMFMLTISGLLLYYAGNETLRDTSSLLHWLIGIAGGIALLVHGVIVPRDRRRD